MLRQIVLDTETTGLSADNGDRIIEIGCVELLGRRLTGRHLHHYLNPERDSHEDALRVHGLTTEFLRDKPLFSQVVDEVLDFVQGAQLIIHNAPFDMGFLNKELQLLGRAPLHHSVDSVIDTLKMAKGLYPGKRNSLDALCERLGVNNTGRTLHGALLDAQLLADVYIGLTRGQEALLIPTDSPASSAHRADRDPELHSAAQAVQSHPLATEGRAWHLPVLHASEQERAAHEEVLAQIDKASGGKTLWYLWENSKNSPKPVQ